MAIHSREFNSYLINYYTGNSRTYTAAIFLKRFNDSVGAMYFYRADEQLPLSNQENNGTINLFFYIESFPTILNMLQSEGPYLYLYVNTTTNSGFLRVNSEPVGEEES